MPAEVAAAVRGALAELCPGGEAVAVRSSAIGEDSAEHSFAGQHLTLLAVTGVESTLAAIRACVDSLQAESARSYRQWRSAQPAQHMAVIVQRMLRPDAAGVAFTADPVTGSRERVVVEAVTGLGEGLVSGTRPAHRWVFERDGLALVEEVALEAGPVMAVALARPLSTRLTDRIEHEGIDIVVALDLSDSMEQDDLYPTRLEAAKRVIDEFIARRPRDRLGVVAFGSRATTVAPLTADRDVLRLLVGKLQLGSMDGSRTAIGAGIGMALNRLKESEAESQVVVLLTDGVHNAEGLDPDSAAKEAAERGIRVYTVLIGRHTGQNIDPGRLERIASSTGGFAYTAEDQEALATSFQDLLDKLERSTIEGEAIRAELFYLFLWPALALLLLDVLLRSTRLRRFP